MNQLEKKLHKKHIIGTAVGAGIALAGILFRVYGREFLEESLAVNIGSYLGTVYGVCLGGYNAGKARIIANGTWKIENQNDEKEFKNHLRRGLLKYLLFP